MDHPKVVLFVRFKTALSLEEVSRIAEERASEFRALHGLQQKHYLYNEETQEYAGLYLWKSAEALAEFRDSELRASIAQAYQVQGKPSVDVYRVAKTLRSNTP